MPDNVWGHGMWCMLCVCIFNAGVLISGWVLWLNLQLIHARTEAGNPACKVKVKFMALVIHISSSGSPSSLRNHSRISILKTKMAAVPILVPDACLHLCQQLPRDCRFVRFSRQSSQSPRPLLLQSGRADAWETLFERQAWGGASFAIGRLQWRIQPIRKKQTLDTSTSTRL